MSNHKKAFRASILARLSHVKLELQSLKFFDLNEYYYGSGGTSLIEYSDRNYQSFIHDTWTNLGMIEVCAQTALTVGQLDKIAEIIGHLPHKMWVKS